MASELVILLRTTFAYQLTTRLAETHFLQFLLAVFEPKHERDERNRHELENRDGSLHRIVRSGSSCADAAVVAAAVAAAAAAAAALAALPAVAPAVDHR